jgi:hypothetical protein
MPDSTPDEKLLAPSTRRLSLEGGRALEMLVTSGPSRPRMDNADSFKPLAEIAELIRSLTYGEMVEVVSELQKAPVETKQIDKLATLIRCLTYGEMLELASELQKTAEAREITAETLPAILHRWASKNVSRHGEETGTAQGSDLGRLSRGP